MNADFLAVEKTGVSQKTRIIQIEDSSSDEELPGAEEQNE